MSKRQLAMVIDLNKCIGCQTCTVACKTEWTNRDGREYMYWNHVESYPSRGYPKNWVEMGGGFDKDGNIKDGIIPNIKSDYGTPWEYDYDAIIDQDFTNIDDTIAPLRPDIEPTFSPNWDEDIGVGNFPTDNFSFYIPRICNHCTTPTCLSACPRDAIFKRDEDGVVLVDLDKCQGYRYCIAGCPYKKIYFNPKISKSEKCNFCFPRVERGLPPACASQCVGRTRFVGFLDDKEGQVYQLVKRYKVALPLKGEYGTQPNVYYIPPISTPLKYDAHGRVIDGSNRVPMDMLETLFGVGVHDAIKILKEEQEKRKKGKDSHLLDLLISYKHADMFRLDSKYYQKVAKDRGKKPLDLLDNRYSKGVKS